MSTCFVVQGFGKKTDFTDGRVLDLDASYAIIKETKESIDAYSRGFHLKQDYHNGINLAFLLELRALNALKAGERDEGITDSILVKRIRREVIKYTEPLPTKDFGDDKRYWILATL